MRVALMIFYAFVKWYSVQFHNSPFITLAITLLIIFTLLWVWTYPRQRRVQHYYR